MSPTRNRWYWLGLALLTVAAIGYAHQRDLFALQVDYQASEDEVRMLQRQLEQTAASETQLQQRVEQLHNDPLELEAAIRGTKRLVREGETIYRVPLTEDPENQNSQAVP